MTLAVSPEKTAATKIPLLDAEIVASILADGRESALVDVREEGVYGTDGHILLSVPLPLSRLELRAALLLPRKSVRVIVTDAGDGVLVARAAQKLKDLGYSDVSLLDGGVAAWEASGREVYTGSGAYTKAFGEFVEHAYGTPHLSATELKAKLDAGEDVVVLDGRTVKEFENFSIPGAYAIPNAELPYRVHDLLPSDDTLVVVNCAGRTRSIIGAQALINAGLPNRVVALENGTMDWLKHGFALDHGTVRHAPAPSDAALDKALASVERLTERYGIRWLDDAALGALRDEAGTRSLYLYDVRTAAEFERGHLAGSHWAEGGQLVQALDRYAAVRNGRIVVIDDADGVRAAITASWLIQLGWGEVFAHRLGETGLETGPDTVPLAKPAPVVDTVTAIELKALLADGKASVIDLADSLTYEAGHIPGAHFAVRSRLDDVAGRAPSGTIVLTSPDGVLATFAARELAVRLGDVRVLAGGTAAWRAAGFEVETGATSLLHARDDVWRSPYQVEGDRQAAFKAYLDWEIALLDQIQRDGAAARFAVFR